MCDASCPKYGDCCTNSTYFNDAVQRRAVSSFKCVHVEGYPPIYRKDSCPPSFKNLEIRRQCEKSSDVRDVRYPILVTPVTHTRSNVTYGNIYCAICNGDVSPPKELEFWDQGLKCMYNKTKDLPPKCQQDCVQNNLKYNETEGVWQVVFNNLAYECELTASITDKAKSHVRSCVPTINTCPAGWKNEDIRNRCESYTLVVYMPPNKTNAIYGNDSSVLNYNETEIAYRNVHCAMCNNAPVQELECETVRTTSLKNIFGVTPSFSVLLNFTRKDSVGGNQPCNKEEQVYDSFFRYCRDILYEYQEFDMNRVLEMKDCSRVALTETEFTTVEGRVYVSKYNTWYEPNQFIRRDRMIEICLERSVISGSRMLVRSKPYFNLITTFGIGISIICLCCHLIVFAIVKELRNLSGKNLASMCFALLIAYSSFMLSNLFKDKACVVNAVVTYYFFLAAFTWMLVMSFDVWRTLRIATKELRVSSGKQWRKFFIYSFCSWALPAKIVLIALLVDLCPMGFVSEQLKPRFGREGCWFSHGPALLLFFGLPLFLILVCNVSFFLSSAYMIYSTHSMTRYSASPNTKRDFRLYARLALIMGLTWIMGLVAGFANNEALWVLFILLNTSLGLFIFIAFTCRKSVLHALKNLKRDSGLNLPAFSWSVNTSEDGKTSSRVENKTSNTYY